MSDNAHLGRFLWGWGVIVALAGALLTAVTLGQLLRFLVATSMQANPAAPALLATAFMVVQLGLLLVSMHHDWETRAVFRSLRQGVGCWSDVRRLYWDNMVTVTIFGLYWIATSDPLLEPAYVHQMRAWGWWAFGAAIAYGVYVWWRRRSEQSGAPS